MEMENEKQWISILKCNTCKREWSIPSNNEELEKLKKTNTKHSTIENIACEGIVKFHRFYNAFKNTEEEIKESLLDKYISDKNIGGIDEVIGLENVKEILYDTLIGYFKNKYLYDKYETPPGGSLILYGPPGTGKSLIVKSATKQYGSDNIIFEKVNASALISHKRGESGETIHNAFKLWKSYNKPTVIFIDEIDSLVPNRTTTNSILARETTSAMLIEMDDAYNIYIVGGTNFIESIDPAFLRSGRVDDVIGISYPNKKNRIKLFEKCFKGLDFLSNDVDINELATHTNEYTGADIVKNVRKKIVKLHIRKINSELPDTLIYQDEIMDVLGIIHKPELDKKSETDRVLNVLINSNKDGLYHKEITQLTSMFKPNVTRAINKLIENGKIFFKKDGRFKIFYLTNEARKDDQKISNIAIFKCGSCNNLFEIEIENINDIYHKKYFHNINGTKCKIKSHFQSFKKMSELNNDINEIYNDTNKIYDNTDTVNSI